ncbi:MAG: DUF993 family protein [Micromonosporaceae bacterium]|nr:DUF993 family protein [Micromonosporaceae bacterium]
MQLRPGDRYRAAAPARSRIAYAAAHVVADPAAENTPDAPAVLDWDATLAVRHHLWRYGLGVAEAMDTAQRGAGLDYPVARDLIRRSAAEARSVGGAICAGVGTDQLPPGESTLDLVTDAYRRQLDEVLAAGVVPVLMCSRQLAATARTAEAYLTVYTRLIRHAGRPVILHWLGPAFDPALAGYWGAASPEAAGQTVLAIARENPGGLDGVKLSLLDEAYEVKLRAELPAGVHLYTGDDFNYPALIKGDAAGYSDALLGVFATIAPAASAALHALDAGDIAGYDAAFAPTVPLARQLFAAPTRFYKTGIAFLAWLAGHQEHFTMVAGAQSGRSAVHLGKLLRLADEAGLLPDPELAAARARAFFTVAGIAQ